MITLSPFALALVTALAAPAQAAGFVDVLAKPAAISPLASKGLLQGVARAGERLVAVGQRGHIVVSPDGGATWKQASVPVSSDLTAVYLANERKGWAVGHDGVILATADGGVTWSLQLDGKRANEAVLAELTRTGASAELLGEAKRNVELGADKPFLDVWFADESTGYVVGAYNLIFRTGDGGKSWTPWFDRTDNPKFLNLYAIRPAAGGLFIVGEAGLVLKLDEQAQRFRALTLPYQGTLFGVTGDARTLLVFGLRGNAFRSEDAGSTFAKVDTGLPASIVAGAALGDGAFALADISGRVATTRDGGKSWQPLALATPMMLAGLADAGGGKLALAGARGVVIASFSR
ncbi:MAG: glycosyl hydrolase [Burkholderiales bacterium]|nr:glycosyl hydrolase [Burkholderiales bacterium]